MNRKKHFEMIQENLLMIHNDVQKLSRFLTNTPTVPIKDPDVTTMCAQQRLSVHKVLRQEHALLLSALNHCSEEILHLQQIQHSLHQIQHDQTVQINMPTCELKRCAIYSQWVDLPREIWFIIADYADSHHLWTVTNKTWYNPKLYEFNCITMYIKTSCWCNRRPGVLAEVAFHRTDNTWHPIRSDGGFFKVRSYLQEGGEGCYFQIETDEAFPCWNKDLKRYLEQVYQWHQDYEWPNIHSTWLE